MRGAISTLHLYAFMAWCLVKAQGQLLLLPTTVLVFLLIEIIRRNASLNFVGLIINLYFLRAPQWKQIFQQSRRCSFLPEHFVHLLFRF